MHDKPKVTIDLAEYEELKKKQDLSDTLMDLIKTSTTAKELDEKLRRKSLDAEYHGQHYTLQLRLLVDGRPLDDPMWKGRTSNF